MGRLRALVLGLPFVVIIVLGCLVALPYCASCGGAADAVTVILKRCKAATDALGDDAHPARLGCACGSTELSGGNGTASWTLAYTGSRDRGTVSYDAVKRGGEWHVDRASLEVGDGVIDLVACASGGLPAVGKPTGRLSQTNADAAKATFDGKVIRSTHPTLTVGTACKGNMARERGSPTAHVTVTCGAAEGALNYDGNGTFTMDVRDAARPDDDHVEYDDSASPTKCRISAAEGKGTLTLWSTAPAWELVVEL